MKGRGQTAAERRHRDGREDRKKREWEISPTLEERLILRSKMRKKIGGNERQTERENTK